MTRPLARILCAGVIAACGACGRAQPPDEPAVARPSAAASLPSSAARASATTEPKPSASALSAVELAELGPVGRIAHATGRAGVVVAAPHGSADTGTFELANEVGRRTGAGLVTATGWFIDRPGWSGRYNVNRPTERIADSGGTIVQPKSRIAEHANRWYVEQVRLASGASLRVFFELHVNLFPENAGAIEVATLGVDVQTARRFKLALERARDARPALPLLVHVEPDSDPGGFSYRLTTTVDFAQQAFMIEMPAPSDARLRDRYAVLLSDAIGSFLGSKGE